MCNFFSVLLVMNSVTCSTSTGLLTVFALFYSGRKRESVSPMVSRCHLNVFHLFVSVHMKVVIFTRSLSNIDLFKKKRHAKTLLQQHTVKAGKQCFPSGILRGISVVFLTRMNEKNLPDDPTSTLIS